MNPILKFFAFLRLAEAIREADNAAAATGRRFYVIPDGGLKPRLYCIDRANFRRFRQKRYIPQDMKVPDMARTCFYYSASKNGPAMSRTRQTVKRRRQYYPWFGMQRTLLAQMRRAKRKAKKNKSHNGKQGKQPEEQV